MPSALRRRRGTSITSSSSSSKKLQCIVLTAILLIFCMVAFLLVSMLGSLNNNTSNQQQHTLLRHSKDDPVKTATTAGIQQQAQQDVIISGQVAAAAAEDESSSDASTTTTTMAKEADKHNHGAGGAVLDDSSSNTTPQDIVKNNNNANELPPYPYMPTELLVSDTHDFTSWTAPGGGRYEEYKDGESPYHITPTIQTQSDNLARSRRSHVKRAMQHAWKSYEEFAFGQDELAPQSGKGSSHWGGMGTTLVDSLDTLWLMGLKPEFYRARDWVREELEFSTVGAVSFFETTIRSLGGLLSAYDWSRDEVFLQKANDLGERLFKAFTSPSGLPYGQVNLGSGRTNNIGWTGGNAIIAEGGTVQLEFRYLAKLTDTKKYATASEKAFRVLRDMNPPHALYPYFIRIGKQVPEFANDKLTFGAMADSFYEYMLKVWLQGGKVEPMYRDMYDASMQGMHDELLQTSTPSGLTFIADKAGDRLDTKMDHLVCFMGGLLALGAYTDPLGLDSERAQRDLKTGKALTYTCYQMYARMPTGIAAEFVQFYPGKDFEPGRGAPHYLLRPETVESFFILNYLTGDPVYREWGWEVFQAIERYCKTKYAYGALTDVRQPEGIPRDSMESFFLAETLKYLYLLFDPDTEVDILHKHVFNTEAHPLRMFPVIDDEATAA